MADRIATLLESVKREARLEEAKWWVPLVPNGISKSIEESRDTRIAGLERLAKEGHKAWNISNG